MCIIAQSSDLDKRSQCEKHGKLLPQDTALRRGRASRRPRRRQIFPLATPLRQYALRGASILRHPAPISRSRQSCLFAPPTDSRRPPQSLHVEHPCAVTPFAAFPCWVPIQTSRPSRCFYVKPPLRGSAFHGISPLDSPLALKEPLQTCFRTPHKNLARFSCGKPRCAVIATFSFCRRGGVRTFGAWRLLRADGALAD